MIRRHRFPPRQSNIDDMLGAPYISLRAIDKLTAMRQVREYAFANLAVHGTNDDNHGVFAQVGKAAGAHQL